jgi:murein hydrolase activator
MVQPPPHPGSTDVIRAVLAGLVAATIVGPATAQRSAEASLLELSAQEHVLLDEMALIETRLLVLHTELEALHIHERHLESHLLELDADLAGAEEDLEAKRTAVRGRARALYMGSERGFLQLLFSAEDLGELIQGSRFLIHVLVQDEQLLAGLRSQHEDVDDLRAERQAEYDKLRVRIGERQISQAEQRDLRERRTGLLSSVRSDRRAVALAATESYRAEEAVVEATTPVVVAEVAAEAPASDDVVSEPLSLGLGHQRGRLILPAVGDIVGTYGWYDVEGADDRAFRQGIDIGASRGDEVRAVYAAQVRRSEWMRGLGNAIILDHGEGYFTIYGHLETLRVNVGEMVTASQPIGTVGDSGSPLGVLLHFEIRHHSEAVDPLDWVQLPPGVQIRD